MIVAVDRLLCAARSDVVHLGRDTVGRSKPGFAGKREYRVAVVFDKKLRISLAHLLDRVPYAFVVPEVIALSAVGPSLFLHDFAEQECAPIDRGNTLEGIPNHENAGAIT